MTKTNVRIFLTVCLALLIVACGDEKDILFQAGVNAYNRGDYETALKKFLPLAKQGLAAAQLNLGLMYANGQGGPQDYTEARKWYRRAADQGAAGAQHNLGVMYYEGQGGPKDYVLASMWLTLAAAQDAKFAEAGDFIEDKLTPDQLAETQRLAREWKVKAK